MWRLIMRRLVLFSEDDVDLQKHLKNKTSNYTCHDSQNEIISLLAEQIKLKQVKLSFEETFKPRLLPTIFN